MARILAVLPLALTMNLGPQTVGAIIIVTGKGPVRKYLAYIAAITVDVVTITFVAYIVFHYIHFGSGAGGQSQTSQVLDYVFAGLLALLGVRAFLKRREARKPRWMSTLQDARPGGIFKIGLMLYSLMPTDLISMLTVAHYLASRQQHFYACIPFVFLTLLIAALPLLFYLLFKKRAQEVMPRVQDWMDTHAWVVNEVVIVFFICMILFT
jgi:threonine/homoserine/homoserine lactone efflux protein